MDRVLWAKFSPFVGTYPEDLLPGDIDAKIRTDIVNINNSGWVWTAYCCEGHAFKTGSLEPYLVFVTKTKHMPDLLRCIYESTPRLPLTIRNQDHSCPLNWSQIAIYYNCGTKDIKATLQESRKSIRRLAKSISITKRVCKNE